MLVWISYGITKGKNEGLAKEVQYEALATRYYC